MLRLAWLPYLVGISGCSLLLDGDEFRGHEPDAVLPDAPPVDAFVYPDADPTLLGLSKVTPSEVFEGQGSGEGRGVPVFIEGEHIASDAQVFLRANDMDVGAVVIEGVTPSADRRGIGFVVRVPVDTGLGEGDLIEAELVVVQSGGPEPPPSLPFTVRFLDELEATGPTFDTSTVLEAPHALRQSGQHRV